MADNTHSSLMALMLRHFKLFFTHFLHISRKFFSLFCIFGACPDVTSAPSLSWDFLLPGVLPASLPGLVSV